jgi:hypothetical protein
LKVDEEEGVVKGKGKQEKEGEGKYESFNNVFKDSEIYEQFGPPIHSTESAVIIIKLKII